MLSLLLGWPLWLELLVLFYISLLAVWLTVVVIGDILHKRREAKDLKRFNNLVQVMTINELRERKNDDRESSEEG